MTGEQLLALLPNGSLPWIQDTVDQMIGEGTYDEIHTNISHMLNSFYKGNVIFVTHTQQINATAEQYQLPIERLGTYGFLLIPQAGTIEKAQIFTHGVFQ
jgi:sulfatase maturation enzyme AslB (radical SAM superfamily)